MKMEIENVQRDNGKKFSFVVLGMHRSGTSALTRVLSLAGCTLPATLLTSTKGNLRGHWESGKFNEINNVVLESAGSSWDEWSSFSTEWYESPKAAEMYARVAAAISSEIGETHLSVLKDPRICKIFPVWAEALEAIGHQVLPVLILRHPAEVAESLLERNKFDRDIGQLIWLRYVLDAERATRGQPRALISYEALLQDWKSCLKSISATFGVKFPMPLAKMAPKVAEFLSPELRHHSAREMPPLSGPGLSPWASDVWEVFNRWLETGESADDYAKLDAVHQALDQSQEVFERLTKIAQTALEREAQVSDLKTTLAERDVSNASLQQTVEMVKASLAEIQNTNTALDSKVALLSAKLSEAEAHNRRLTSELDTTRNTAMALSKDRHLDAARIQELERKLNEAQTRPSAAQDLSELQNSNRELQAKSLKLMGQFDDAQASTRRVAKLAAERDAQISALKAEIKGLRKASPNAPRAQSNQKLTSELMIALFSGVRFPVVHDRRLKNYVDLVKRLKLVDAEWYVRQNLDVAASKLSAEEHFIRFGAREGRAPNPQFNDARHLR